MDQQTLQGELCRAYFDRMKASIPNCLKLMKHPPGPSTPPRWAPPPWLPGSPPMGHNQASPARPRILGPHLSPPPLDRMKALIPNCLQNDTSSTALNLPWPFCILVAYGSFTSVAAEIAGKWPRCEVSNVVKSWLSHIVVYSEDEHEYEDPPVEASLIDPTMCRDLADFLRARSNLLQTHAADPEEEQTAIESNVVWLECLALAAMPDAVYHMQSAKSARGRGSSRCVKASGGEVKNQITCYDAGFLAQVFVFTLDLNLQSNSDVEKFGQTGFAKKMLTCLD